LTVFLAVLAAGCGKPPAPMPPRYEVINDFRLGEAHIKPGQTKAEVLAEIARSSARPRLSIRTPVDASADLWELRWGGSPYAAGFIRIQFSDGKVTSLQRLPIPLR